MPRQPEPKPAKTAKDYEEIGRMLDNIYLTGYVDRKQMFKMSLLKGIAGGLGGVIGATIIVALLAWTLSLFEQVPLLGPLFDNVENTVKTQP